MIVGCWLLVVVCCTLLYEKLGYTRLREAEKGRLWKNHQLTTNNQLPTVNNQQPTNNYQLMTEAEKAEFPIYVDCWVLVF
ncbi:hypothetical protein [Fischerella sp. PCC 9605]|uniref:hypothetical protein n=1 Tax=Fischerella sp. PCC 9605 TaxID=1173024 RepID=UPI00047E874D|nr:hypothetical protein [Fischerella sp. PCC 9605]